MMLNLLLGKLWIRKTRYKFSDSLSFSKISFPKIAQAILKNLMCNSMGVISFFSITFGKYD